MRHCTPSLAIGALFALGLLANATVQAQVDPLLAEAELDAQPMPSAWRMTADFSARGESTTGFGNRDDIERARTRLRLGTRHDGDQWTIAAAAKLGAGSDSNRDNRRNLDNEKSNGIGLDELWVGYRVNDGLEWQLGKGGLPLATTPLTWDTDLRPIGASLRWSRPSGDFNRVSAVAGHFAGDHLYGDQSRISAAQFGWHYQEGAPFSAEVLLAWWHFSDLERARQQGLTRSNRVSNGRLLSDYRILNLQFGAQWMLDQTPLSLRLDLVENQGAEEDNRGARFSAVHGDSRLPEQWELAVAYQRIGRDAVSAAFNADDWWFHSATRGVMPWVAYGFNETWRMQLSGFYERLDGQDEHITRVLLDLSAQW